MGPTQRHNHTTPLENNMRTRPNLVACAHITVQYTCMKNSNAWQALRQELCTRHGLHCDACADDALMTEPAAGRLEVYQTLVNCASCEDVLCHRPGPDVFEGLGRAVRSNYSEDPRSSVAEGAFDDSRTLLMVRNLLGWSGISRDSHGEPLEEQHDEWVVTHRLRCASWNEFDVESELLIAGHTSHKTSFGALHACCVWSAEGDSTGTW